MVSKPRFIFQFMWPSHYKFFMVQNGTQMVQNYGTNIVQVWYKYGTSMVQSQNMVQLWRKFGRIMVQNYGTSMGEIWGTEFPQISPIIVPYCTIVCTIF